MIQEPPKNIRFLFKVLIVACIASSAIVSVCTAEEGITHWIPPIIECRDEVSSVAIASGDQNNYVYAIGCGDDFKVGGHLGGAYFENGSVRNVALSTDGRYAVAWVTIRGLGNILYFTSSGIGDSQTPQFVSSMSFTPDGEYLATLQGGGITVYRTRDGILQWSSYDFGGIGRVSVLSDSQRLAAGSRDGKVYYFSLAGNTLSVKKIADSFDSASISADGQYIAVTMDNEVCLFSSTGTLLWSHPHEGTEYYNRFYDVAISADGQYISAHDGYAVYLLSHNGTCLWSKETAGSINCMSMSADGQYIIAGSGNKAYIFENDPLPAPDATLPATLPITTETQTEITPPLKSTDRNIDNKYLLFGLLLPAVAIGMTLSVKHIRHRKKSGNQTEKIAVADYKTIVDLNPLEQDYRSLVAEHAEIMGMTYAKTLVEQVETNLKNKNKKGARQALTRLKSFVRETKNIEEKSRQIRLRFEALETRVQKITTFAPVVTPRLKEAKGLVSGGLSGGLEHAENILNDVEIVIQHLESIEKWNKDGYVVSLPDDITQKPAAEIVSMIESIEEKIKFLKKTESHLADIVQTEVVLLSLPEINLVYQEIHKRIRDPSRVTEVKQYLQTFEKKIESEKRSELEKNKNDNPSNTKQESISEIVERMRASKKARSQKDFVNPSPVTDAPPAESEMGIIIERTIYDPVSGEFILKTSRPLANVKKWIESHDPASYWLVCCVKNSSDKPIGKWGIELKTNPSLKITAARVVGMEEKFEIRTSSLDMWHDKYIFGVLPEQGIYIPERGSKQIYFKLGNTGFCPSTYKIGGTFQIEDQVIPIREKEFTFSCDVATYQTTILENPDTAEKYTRTMVRRKFDSDTALVVLQASQYIMKIKSACHEEKYKEMTLNLSSLKDIFKQTNIASTRIITAVEHTQDAVRLLGEGEESYDRVNQSCDLLLNIWQHEFVGK